MLMLIPQRPNFNWWFENKFGTELHWLDFWEEKKLSLKLLDWRSFHGIKDRPEMLPKLRRIQKLEFQFCATLVDDSFCLLLNWGSCINHTYIGCFRQTLAILVLPFALSTLEKGICPSRHLSRLDKWQDQAFVLRFVCYPLKWVPKISTCCCSVLIICTTDKEQKFAD